MNKINENELVPRLRFLEFDNDGEWKVEPLGKLSNEITEKTKGRKYKLMSVTTGIGLVSQIEKFGREIAGNSYINYYVINKGDFAYNKSSTKLYPEGEISLLEKEEQGAVPNSIFTCFRLKNNVYPLFAKYQFVNNIHGRWLIKFIAVGARANGALQVNSRDLFSIPFPYPSLEEQQKIASCLSSLDEVITAERKKLDLLQHHKKGLLQNLFPQEGETVPKFRFKEFEKSGDWEEATLDQVATFVNDKTSLEKLSLNTYISTENLLPDYEGVALSSKLPASGNFTKYRKGDVLISNIRPYLKKVWFADKDGACSNDVIVIRANSVISDAFLSFLLRNDAFISYVMKGAEGVKMPRGDKDLIREYPITFPENKFEQKKNASCLSSIDELINAQSQKVEALKLHKKGLLQGLFPDVSS